MKNYNYRAVLTIAGSDSGGGAGIQADIKTFSALGCFGTSAITAITVQNTTGVSDIHGVPPEIVKGQILVVLDDIPHSAVKIGMVHSPELVTAITEALQQFPAIPIILDPVMVATSGDRLIKSETVDLLKKDLFPLASLITPNLDEAAILADMEIKDIGDMKEAAKIILSTGCNAVLVKGGHLQGKELYNVYLDKNGRAEVYSSEHIDTNNTHGTGCTLSSAIAALVARGLPLSEAIKQAGEYVHAAINEGQDVKTGQGNGPLNHFFNPQKMLKYEME